MLKYLSIVVMLFGIYNANAQVTINPKVAKKSTNDTFINKIEITDDYTVVWMQFVAKSKNEQLKEYLNNNPKEKEKLSRMNPMMRNMILQQMMEGSNFSNSISIQPTSFLKAGNGTKFKFVKASSIPVAPDRKVVEPDQKYFFKVYFEKLSPGIQKVDLVEGDSDERDGFQYWNFYGVIINNPAEGKEEKQESREELAINPSEITMNGKVFDAVNNQPIQARILCKIEKDGEIYDSLFTSRTGYFEFLLKPDTYIYQIEAEGYEPSEEWMDLNNLKNIKSFTRDIFLNPFKKENEETQAVEVQGTEEKVILEDVEKVDDKTFRLNNVYFPLGEATILKDSYRELDKVLGMMKENPKMKIRIDGHTDNIGDSKQNLILSIDRAKNVRDYLIQNGISADRLSFKGWGDTKPLVDNHTDVSRQKNRRVEIVIL